MTDKKFDLGKLLKDHGLVRDREDPASLARVQKAMSAVLDALDAIEGLTDGERSQALSTLAGYQGVRNIVSRLAPREGA